MKAKLLLSAAVIGLVAMSPALAETITVPLIPGSLDGADSAAGDGGIGGPASATANSPSDSTNSAFATGGAGGSGGVNGGDGGAATASATTTRQMAQETASSVSTATGGAGGAGGLSPPFAGNSGNGGAADAAATTTTPSASGTVSATATATGGDGGSGPFPGTGLPEETAAMQRLRLPRSAAVARSMCRPARWGQQRLQRRGWRLGPAIEWRAQVRLSSANRPGAPSLSKDPRRAETRMNWAEAGVRSRSRMRSAASRPASLSLTQSATGGVSGLQ